MLWNHCDLLCSGSAFREGMPIFPGDVLLGESTDAETLSCHPYGPEPWIMASVDGVLEQAWGHSFVSQAIK